MGFAQDQVEKHGIDGVSALDLIGQHQQGRRHADVVKQPAQECRLGRYPPVGSHQPRQVGADRAVGPNLLHQRAIVG